MAKFHDYIFSQNKTFSIIIFEGIYIALSFLWAGDTFIQLGPFAFFGLCGLTHHLVVSVLLLAGCYSYKRELLLPWLVQTMVGIIIALILGPLFIYRGVHFFQAIHFFLGISVRIESWTLTGGIMIAIAGTACLKILFCFSTISRTIPNLKQIKL